MNFTLHQLKIFLAVCKYQSITKASQALSLTQPAVSIQLKKLQQQFEIPLTEVIGRKLYITDFGKKIEEVSERILSESSEIKSAIDRYKGLLSGKITISVVSTGKYVMPYFLNGFVKRHPQLEILMDVTNKYKVVEALERNETDLALVSVIPDQVEVAAVPLMKNHLYLIGNKEESQKLKKKILTPADLGKLPLIFREDGSATRKAMEGFIERHQVQANKTLKLVSNEAVKQAVNAGLGFSIMPLIGLRNELINGDLQMIPVKNLPIITTWRLVFLSQKKLSIAAEAYLDYVHEAKVELIEKHFSWTREFISE